MISSSQLVSIIITTYKRPDYLKKTLESIIRQTYKNLEIIVVNDDNKDSISSLIESCNDNRLKLIEIIHSGRPSIPRNIGLLKAQGEYIAFCDDDDVFYSNKIEKQIEVFKNNPKVDLCYTNIEIIDENNKLVQESNHNKKQTSFNRMLYKNDITFSSSMIKKTLINKNLMFDERITLKASEDYLFFLRVLYNHKIFFLNESLLKYRIHKNGISYTNNTLKLIKYLKRIIICMWILLKERKIGLIKFTKLIIYHFKHVMKQVAYKKLKEKK